MDLDFFRRCFDEFPDPVIVADMQRRVVFLNNSARLLTGRSTKHGPTALSEFFRSDAGDKRVFPFKRFLDKKPTGRVQACLKDCYGEWRPFSLSAQVIRGYDGRPAGYLAIAREVSASSARAKNYILDTIFPSLISNFPMPFFTVDANMTVTYMNDHLERLTGYSRCEVVNRMTCAQLLRTEHCNTNACTLKQAMESRVSVSGLRQVIQDREGRQIPVSVHSTMMTDSGDNVIGGFEAVRDITPVVEAEQKIRMLIDITQEGILMVDENNRVIYANSKIGDILERRKEEIVGKDVREVLPYQLLNIVSDLVEKVSPEDPQLLRFCSTIQRSETLQQEFRAFETCIVASCIGKSLIVCLYFHDLTKHIEIERQLYDANSFLNNIIMSSADGIVVLDTKGTVLIFNDAAQRILGYSAEEIIGQPKALEKLCRPELAREVMRRMRSDEHGKLASTRVTLVRKDGEEVPVNFSAAIIKKQGREIGSVGIFSDLRERMRIRKELEEAKIQLMQAEKIASIGRLAAGVAHEINNPLSGILIYADILLKELSHSAQCSEDLQEIINQTLRCKEIVTRLLNFSRQSVGRLLSLDINLVIRGASDLLAKQALFQNIEFIMDLQPDIPQMKGDPGQLQQVFTNLILNAGVAIKGKGKILIGSRFDHQMEKVVLTFEDTGPGISPDIMGKIFEPFFTTKGPGEGTGLGLSVAYGIIQQHGGGITAGNSPSGGAVFTVVLPLECPESQIEFTFHA